MMSHTSKPWRRGIGNDANKVFDSEGRIVASHVGYTDGHLIAAAPELWAACQMQEIDFIDQDDFLRQHGWDGTGDALEFIDKYRRTAIAKAGGIVPGMGTAVNPDSREP